MNWSILPLRLLRWGGYVIAGILIVLGGLYAVAKYDNPSWTHVASDFKENRSSIDLLVREFIRESKVDYIEERGRGLVSIALINKNGWGEVDNPWGLRAFRLKDVPLDGQALGDVLDSVKMQRDTFKKIVSLMEASDVRSISFGMQHESPLPHIKIEFPNRRSGCSWFFVTPVEGHLLKDFVDSLAISYSEDGLHIVDDEWVAWRYCAM